MSIAWSTSADRRLLSGWPSDHGDAPAEIRAPSPHAVRMTAHEPWGSDAGEPGSRLFGPRDAHGIGLGVR